MVFSLFEINIDDVRGKRRYSRNILQWSKNNIKSKKSTNGDYYLDKRWNLELISASFFNAEIESEY